MTRAVLPLLLLGVAALAGCAREEPNRIVVPSAPAPVIAAAPEAPPPAARPGRTSRGRAAAAAEAAPPPPPEPMRAPAPGEVYRAPAPTAAQRDQAALIAACRQQAERVILERDRPQILREEEQAARMGASGSLMDSAFNSDRLGRIFARDRMVEDCVERNRPLPPRATTQAPPR
jgi:hypothetical protein